MSRYYFDMRSGDDLVEDEKGLELQDVISAHRHAYDIALRAQSILAGDGWMSWSVIIRDRNRSEVAVVPFPMALGYGTRSCRRKLGKSRI